MNAKLQTPANPLIDGLLHHATAANIASVLETIMGMEEHPPGMFLILQTARDAARFLSDAMIDESDQGAEK